MTKTYSPKRLVLTVAGQRIEGFGDTDIVSVTLDEPKFVKYIGADGQVSRSFNPASSGRFTITLAQTSSANQILSAILLADVADNTGNLVVPVTLRDLNSSDTFYIGTNCWVENMPESNFGKEIDTREWVLDAEKIFYNISGNGESLLQGILPNI